jgi:hypothetical protein
VLKANFEAYEIMHLLTDFGEYFVDCVVGYCRGQTRGSPSDQGKTPFFC